MIAVQGGTFAMGSNGSAPDEKMHTVTISDFKMSKYEITQAIWIAIMGNNPSAHTGCNNCPVERVSWEMLPEFIFKLNMQTGKNYRLPTEAEWEYAATGGIKTNSYKYAGNNTVDAIGWYNENSNKNTHEVGQKQPNELGLYDMTGNVWEWCSDWYGNDYYAHSPSKNPKGGINGTRKVCRGGSYNSEAIKCHNTLRNGMPPYQRKEMGFRLVLQQ